MNHFSLLLEIENNNYHFLARLLPFKHLIKICCFYPESYLKGLARGLAAWRALPVENDLRWLLLLACFSAANRLLALWLPAGGQSLVWV
ncbi:MAG: hypothetical protein Q4C74_03975 [Rothia sp. (in: high G+C Gram-positive bacteria)]|nr:hypothetical protein [Rothia sp. (in: high G+C Gram-positive bacteria)]